MQSASLLPHRFHDVKIMKWGETEWHMATATTRCTHWNHSHSMSTEPKHCAEFNIWNPETGNFLLKAALLASCKILSCCFSANRLGRELNEHPAQNRRKTCISEQGCFWIDALRSFRKKREPKTANSALSALHILHILDKKHYLGLDWDLRCTCIGARFTGKCQTCWPSIWSSKLHQMPRRSFAVLLRAFVAKQVFPSDLHPYNLTVKWLLVFGYHHWCQIVIGGTDTSAAVHKSSSMKFQRKTFRVYMAHPVLPVTRCVSCELTNLLPRNRAQHVGWLKPNDLNHGIKLSC